MEIGNLYVRFDEGGGGVTTAPTLLSAIPHPAYPRAGDGDTVKLDGRSGYQLSQRVLHDAIQSDFDGELRPQPDVRVWRHIPPAGAPSPSIASQESTFRNKLEQGQARLYSRPT